MNSNTRAGQWRQLLAVTLAHAVADIYVGFITPLLVPMHERYGVSFGAMVFIAALLGFSANIFQVVIGSVRPTWTRPWLINAGLLLAEMGWFAEAVRRGHPFGLGGKPYAQP